ncbi:MAG: hypothetical protein WC679_00300 [Bacteroidales bacterium]|jgi:hypothetical protein
MIVETTVKYISEDGSVFRTEAECRKYEEAYFQASNIMSRLYPKPIDDNCSFSNGDGYIQQYPRIVELVRTEFDKLATLLGKKEKTSSSYFFSELYPGRLYSMYYRFECIDELGREFGQIYYRNFPEEARLFKLN